MNKNIICSHIQEKINKIKKNNSPIRKVPYRYINLILPVRILINLMNGSFCQYNNVQTKLVWIPVYIIQILRFNRNNTSLKLTEYNKDVGKETGICKYILHRMKIAIVSKFIQRNM